MNSEKSANCANYRTNLLINPRRGLRGSLRRTCAAFFCASFGYCLATLPTLPDAAALNHLAQAGASGIEIVANYPNLPPAPVATINAADNNCAPPLGEITVATLDNTPIVTLIANGTPVTLILDTGAERTVITPNAAQRIGAETPRVEFAKPMHGIARTTSTREVELRNFRAGTVDIPWHRLLVASVDGAPTLSGLVDGLLGADVLSNFDVELDFTNHYVRFYSKSSCPPQWTNNYPPIEAGLSRAMHLFFPVALDDHRITAFLDTGSQRSLITADAAFDLGVTSAALFRDHVTASHGANGGVLLSHFHNFSQLKIGLEKVINPTLIIADVKLEDGGLILGMDYISSRRVWLSYASSYAIISRSPQHEAVH